MRFARIALSGALLAAVTPLALSAQGAAAPRCKDGTVAERTGFTACWFHGGVAPARAAAPRRPSARNSPTSRVVATKTKPAKSKVKKGSAKRKSEARAKRGKKRSVFGIPLSAKAKAQKSKTHKSKAHKSKTRYTSKARAPKGATARCMDGSYTYAARRKKACKDHGGVAGWLKADVPPE